MLEGQVSFSFEPSRVEELVSAMLDDPSPEAGDCSPLCPREFSSVGFRSSPSIPTADSEEGPESSLVC